MNTCELIYKIGGQDKIYGTEKGICRITGHESYGILFEKWVKPTFTDHSYLYPGNIISNEALFCFDEASEIIMNKVGKNKLQRFRSYSHIICDGKWYCLTKADKKLIYELISHDAEMVCLADSGQKHLLFKHRDGLWQLEESHLSPDISLFRLLHKDMCNLLEMGLSQTEILSGNYL